MDQVAEKTEVQNHHFIGVARALEKCLVVGSGHPRQRKGIGSRLAIVIDNYRCKNTICGMSVLPSESNR